MTVIRINEKAYCKIISHAAKYPHCTVNGVLLMKTSSLHSKDIEFIDAVPLFHVCVNLTPMAEIALMQIDEYATKQGLTIGGYYVAPENSRENSFEKMCSRIIEKIAMNNSSSYVIIVNSTITNIQMGDIALKAAQYADGNYKQCEQPKVSNDTINTSMNILENCSYDSIIDFDNHLDDLSLDWTNSKFNKLILL